MQSVITKFLGPPRHTMPCFPNIFPKKPVQKPVLGAINSESRKMNQAHPGVQAVVVHVSCPTKDLATLIADKLVEGQLAACVQSIPGVTSTYMWEGKVERDTEHLLLIKTRKALVEKVSELVSFNHTYDTPEVISTPITGGSAKYLEWLQNVTSRPPTTG